MSGTDRTLLVDASVFITLSEIGSISLMRCLAGEIQMPETVADELTSDPAERELAVAREWIEITPVVDRQSTDGEPNDELATAAAQLGAPAEPTTWDGDVPLLAAAFADDAPVVITDDKPLRDVCKTLSIPVSGSIGVLIRAVEVGELSAATAKDKLVAMDEVGARLSASLFRQAESLIDEADG